MSLPWCPWHKWERYSFKVNVPVTNAWSLSGACIAWSFNQILPTRLKRPLQMTLDYNPSSKKDKGRVNCGSNSNGYLRAIDNN